MLNRDLIILGLLKEGPRHGYQIKKKMREINDTFASIETTSIYYPLKRMEKLAWVKKTKGSSGKREKFTYEITQEGEKVFKSLLHKNLFVLRRPFIDVDLSLYFMQYADTETMTHRLEKRLMGLERIQRWLEGTKEKMVKENAPLNLLSIIEHNLILSRAEGDFIKGFIEKLSNGA